MPIKTPAFKKPPVFLIPEKKLSASIKSELKGGFRFNPSARLEDKMELCEQYQLDRLRAMLKVLGATVIRVQPQLTPIVTSKSTGQKFFIHNKALLSAPMNNPSYQVSQEYRGGYPFPRDQFICLFDKKVILYSNPTIFDSSDMRACIEKNSDYSFIEVNNAYFEGGNVIYCPNAHVLLHGINPVGYYKKHLDVAPAKTNKTLQEVLDKDITVIPIALNLNYLNSKEDSRNYYHLDCFMQLLPDGRLILLNKQFLANESYNRLLEKFDSKLIDLNAEKSAGPDGMMNFVAIGTGKNTVVISSYLNDSIFKALQQNGLTVITPDSLNPSSTKYDIEFAAQVAEKLRDEGYTSAQFNNLLTHLALNDNGYEFSDATHCDKVGLLQCLKTTQSELNQVYLETSQGLIIRKGGPHCLTLEIDRGISPLKKEPKIRLSNQWLFTPSCVKQMRKQANDLPIPTSENIFFFLGC